MILQESKLIVFWANDPIKNLQVGWNTETHESYAYFEQLKQKAADKAIQVICIDPVKSKTLNFLGAAEHQYINPMTDVPLMLAIAHTLVKEGLHDKKFLDTYTLAFDRFLPYLEGKTDFKGYSAVVPIARVIDALLEPGKEIDFNGGKVKLSPYKMAIFSGCNEWHRQPQRKRMKEAWRKLETVVAIDYNWTATCRFADIVLPACTPFERNDLDGYGSYSNRGIIAMQKLIDPLFHSRPDFEIFRGLTRRFNRDAEYTRGMDEMQWVEKIYEDCRKERGLKAIAMPPFAECWKKG